MFRMTELQIHYFLMVSEHLSFTQAAKVLYVSQPSVSRQIAALEAELGFKLFERKSKTAVRLTAAGVTYRNCFLKIRTTIGETHHAAAVASQTETSVLKVGLAGWDWGEEIACICRSMRNEYPQADIRTEVYSFLDLHALLSQDRLDLIFCVETGLRQFENYLVRRICDPDALIYYSASNPVANREHACPSDFADQVLYVLPEAEAPMSREINIACFLRQQFRPEFEVLPNRESIILTLNQGSGFCIMDAWMQHRHDRSLLTIPTGETIPICAVWKKGNPSPLIDRFVALMKNTLAQRK